MQEDWFKTKFVNPRGITINPETGEKESRSQTEQLQYTRELFEAFGNVDPRFSGVAIVGSTMKGYSDEKSDIDVTLFYYEEPRKTEPPEPDSWPAVTFPKNFSRFKENFYLRRKEESKRAFFIDIFPSRQENLIHYFKIDSAGKIEIAPRNHLLLCADIFYPLSYPIIGTQNHDAVMPIKRVLDIMRELVAKASDEEKAKLLEKIVTRATSFLKSDFAKYYLRVNPTADEQEYIDSRIKMLKNQLRVKFGLSVEE